MLDRKTMRLLILLTLLGNLFLIPALIQAQEETPQADVTDVEAEQEAFVFTIEDQTNALFEEVKLLIDARPPDVDKSTVSYSTSRLPPGLWFDSRNNTIEGKLSVIGRFPVTVQLHQAGLPNIETRFFWAVEMPELTLPSAEHSIARQWNELLLEAIRDDFARPTVHARNLHHISSAMYDAWAIYEAETETYLLDKHVGRTYCPLSSPPKLDEMSAAEIESDQQETISYAVYHLLSYRFGNSPGMILSQARFDLLLETLGYSAEHITVNISDDPSPATLGNYIALCYINLGKQDGANEQNDYANQFYTPVNSPLSVQGNTQQIEEKLNELSIDLDHWQPLAFDISTDQSGNLRFDVVNEFLGAEWGSVVPFALSEEDLQVYERDGYAYWVYHDPGEPPYIDPLNGNNLSNEYKWGFSLVPIWASYLDPRDSTTIDISPGALGNNETYPSTIEEMPQFYNEAGGDNSPGHPLNPHTGQPYAPNVVLRGNYGRVIAEFWADGPDSETPPGHWFTLLNTISDHADLEKRYRGEGEILDDLEWDIKAYFVMGGAMHDAAVSVWGIKGWYDYVRPISAVRHMAEAGQSSDMMQSNYTQFGLPLREGLIEIVTEGDPLSGETDENLNKIKLYTWRGPDYIANKESDMAGVGWILAEDWWPYQRPTFVTPPFAGYVSGHSAFSRAAAEVLTLLTGDPYFPGGLGQFTAKKNQFLVFEEGPSNDVVLQWATYRDAADQSAISRIWGGIHPPADDIPARLIGIEVGQDAFAHAESYFFTPTPDPTPLPTPSPTPTPSDSSSRAWAIMQSAGLLIAGIVLGGGIAMYALKNGEQ